MAPALKVTVTLPVEQVEAVRRLVAEGASPNTSAFVRHAVAVALDDIAGWGSMLAEGLAATGGPLTSDERAWADAVLGTENDPGAAA